MIIQHFQFRTFFDIENNGGRICTTGNHKLRTRGPRETDDILQVASQCRQRRPIFSVHILFFVTFTKQIWSCLSFGIRPKPNPGIYKSNRNLFDISESKLDYLPVSAEARILPSGDQRTAFTLFWCLERSHTHLTSIFPCSFVKSSQICETEIDVKIKSKQRQKLTPSNLTEFFLNLQSHDYHRLL